MAIRKAKARKADPHRQDSQLRELKRFLGVPKAELIPLAVYKLWGFDAPSRQQAIAYALLKMAETTPKKPS